MRKKGLISGLAGIPLFVLFALSLNSLTTFPDAYDDEGLYAAYGHGFATTGKFASTSVQMTEEFKAGNAWNPRVNAILFGFAGKTFGHTLVTGRAISFLFIWIAALIWFFISIRLGVPGTIGALLFAANERVFYASHVLRPESALVLVNTLFIFLVVQSETRPVTPLGSSLRGLLNGAFVLAHGNGLVSAVLNTIEWSCRWLKRRYRLALSCFIAASLSAVVVFYLAQFHDVGGWPVAKAQMDTFTQYQIKATLFDNIARDLRLRWGTELIDVGGSVAAKIMRIFFYASVLAASLYSVVKHQGLARKLALLALGCVFGYMILVSDKIDIHIAEMIPYFLGSLLAWVAAGAAKRHLRETVLGGVLVASLALSLHHAVKYSEPSSTQIVEAQVLKYLEGKPDLQPSRLTILGDLKYWFTLRRYGAYLGSRYVENVSPPSGDVLALGKIGTDAKLVSCAVKLDNPAFDFRMLHCNK